MQNTTNYKFSQIVLVHFLFTDQRGGKKTSGAVVVSSNVCNEARLGIIWIAITSNAYPQCYLNNLKIKIA